MKLDSPIQYLKGVGPKLARLLEQKDIRTVRDALFFLPRDYQDRSKIRTIASLKRDEQALIRGTVVRHGYIPLRGRRGGILEAVLDDGTGRISMKWFHFNRAYFDSKFDLKPSLLAFGNVQAYGAKIEMIHPDIEWDAEEEGLARAGGIFPIYSESEGLNQKFLRKIIRQAVNAGAPALADELPEHVRRSFKLVPLREAVVSLHAPRAEASVEKLRAFQTPEQKRLVFDELFRFEWIVGRRRLSLRREFSKPYPLAAAEAPFAEIQAGLPFELTGEQTAAIRRIFEDLASDKPMNRLLQGDVGCGKTLVAFCAALPVIAGGGQAALLAPTEILAEQHRANAEKYLSGLTSLPIRVAILTGSTAKTAREEILRDLAAGGIHLLIGTHALLEDPVVFRELGFAIIDEQHRFGVDQRMRLRAKGRSPHVLSLTATPIPRTLAITAFGDLDVTAIRELPKGRPEILTKIFRESQRETALAQITAELKKGRQAYIIYPLVEESEKIDLANAVSGAEELANGALSGFRVGLLHGRMKSQEKSAIMGAFKRGEIKALVSTTVVEVGVDVPNATILLIEHSERFGLSQLHQLRGRIGRGTERSYCLLMTAWASDVAYERLKAMVEIRDGFRLAELDLEIRGPGEFLGTRQSGELRFRFADLVRDRDLLVHARDAAFDLLKTDPDLVKPEHRGLRDYMERAGHLQQKRFETA